VDGAVALAVGVRAYAGHVAGSSAALPLQ
jgi:hypothetical protein